MLDEYAKIKADINGQVTIVNAAMVGRTNDQQAVWRVRFGLSPSIDVMDVQPKSIGTTWNFTTFARAMHQFSAQFGSDGACRLPLARPWPHIDNLGVTIRFCYDGVGDFRRRTASLPTSWAELNDDFVPLARGRFCRFDLMEKVSSEASEQRTVVNFSG